MKKNIKYIAAILLGGTLGLTSCTDKFEKYNSDEAGFFDEQQQYDFNKYAIQLGIVQKGIYCNYSGIGLNWPFQIMQNLNTDMYAGYFHDFNGAFNLTNDVYNLNDGWNQTHWTYTYGYIFPSIYKSEQLTEADNYPSYLGVTKILKVATMHRVADVYGPLIYSKFGSKTGSDPESLQDAYNAFFSDLQIGIDLIQNYMKEYPGAESFAKFDILTKTKTYDEWLKFANSLRLRLAIRLSNVDPAKAKEQVDKCFSSGIGFLEPGTNLIAVSTAEGTGYSNPLGEINKAWGEVFMNASMESILVGCDDPRLPKFFDKSAGDGEGKYVFDIKGAYKGFRQGIGFEHNNYSGHSRSTITQRTDAVLMTPAEVYFLRAEAALRGFTSEDAKTLYETGVMVSCQQWGVDATAYLKSTNKPSDYKDALDATYDEPAVSKVTPKWDDSASKEEKLERIITQKWIACYPEGCEAWTEQRRTGYPKLFKVRVNASLGTIDTDVMIRRLQTPLGIEKDNPAQYSQLMKFLGGPNTGGTRLWWDTGKNF